MEALSSLLKNLDGSHEDRLTERDDATRLRVFSLARQSLLFRGFSPRQLEKRADSQVVPFSFSFLNVKI